MKLGMFANFECFTEFSPNFNLQGIRQRTLSYINDSFSFHHLARMMVIVVCSAKCSRLRDVKLAENSNEGEWRKENYSMIANDAVGYLNLSFCTLSRHEENLSNFFQFLCKQPIFSISLIFEF